MFTYTYETRYGDYKNYDIIKPGSILDFIQDVSIKDSNRCGYDAEKLKEMKMAWLLQGTNVHFEKTVKPDIPLEISTAIKNLKGATSARGCIIKQNGEIVAKTIANWFIFNVERQRIGKITPEMHDAYEFYDFEDNFFNYQKLELCEIDKAEYTVRIGNKDIDTNMHLNNQKGAELLMDALPFEFYFNNMNVLYKKSAYLGDELEVCVKEIENGYYVHMQTKVGEVCVAGKFENI